MEKKKETMMMRPETRNSVIFKDGKQFRLKKIVDMKNGHTKDVIFEEFDEKEFDRKIEKIADYIIAKTNLNIHDVLTEILKTIPTADIDDIKKKVDRKLHPSLYHGCLSVRIGKSEIQIVD
jgi:phosphoribosylformylglycinamidine (FGAM) synthase PurS component